MNETPDNSKSDSLIEEVRQARADLSAQFGHDVGRLCDYLQEQQRQFSDRLIPATPLTDEQRRLLTQDAGPTKKSA